MQKEIHPEVKETTITCACGEVYHTKSTRENIRVEVCSSCHPAYTGRKRKNAQGGRIERFNAKYGFTDEDEVSETTENEEETAEDTEKAEDE
ncbi:MAG: 50S ribosomal protein L31 [Halanaerobiaceae bacterium]